MKLTYNMVTKLETKRRFWSLLVKVGVGFMWVCKGLWPGPQLWSTPLPGANCTPERGLAVGTQGQLWYNMGLHPFFRLLGKSGRRKSWEKLGRSEGALPSCPQELHWSQDPWSWPGLPYLRLDLLQLILSLTLSCWLYVSAWPWPVPDTQGQV